MDFLTGGQCLGEICFCLRENLAATASSGHLPNPCQERNLKLLLRRRTALLDSLRPLPVIEDFSFFPHLRSTRACSLEETPLSANTTDH